MQQSIGEWFTYNIIIIFIIIVVGILCATVSYYKAFKVNSMILDSIEKFEGYNTASVVDIDAKLNAIGYIRNSDNFKCPKRGNLELKELSGNNHLYCVYYHSDDRGGKTKNNSNTELSNLTNKQGKPIFYNYSVVSYIHVDLPIVGTFKIPVYTKGERTFNFSHSPSSKAGANS